MRFIAGLATVTLLLTSCASTHYHYQNESDPQKWVGKNISAVNQQWGSADQVMHTRSGASYYLYTATSGRNFFGSTTTNFGLMQTEHAFPMDGQGGMKCTAIFVTNAQGVVTSATHSGSNCGGEWAPNKKS